MLLLALAVPMAPAAARAAAPHSHPEWVGETGVASYYSARYQGRRTAFGTRFDQHKMLAAHQWLPYGAKVRVTAMASGESVVVTVADRIYSQHRVIDLSIAAARKLGMVHNGVARVSLSPA